MSGYCGILQSITVPRRIKRGTDKATTLWDTLKVLWGGRGGLPITMGNIWLYKAIIGVL